jgi:AcrR family transcriptional regulator
MASRAEKKDATRRLIINAALRLSAERGFSSLSLRSVAAEAGIAPTSFYRHFTDIDDLGLALVDDVGVSLRRLVREARRRVEEGKMRSVIRASIETFMASVENNSTLFRLLLGEGAGSTQRFRLAIAKEIRRFTDDLAEDLVREAERARRPVAHVHHAAEAMVTVAFNLGVAAIDLDPAERTEVVERIIVEVRLIMRGAQAEAASPARV